MQPERTKFALAKDASKCAAFVIRRLRFYDEGAGNRSFCDSHGMISTVGIGITNAPPHSRMCDMLEMISSRMFQGRMRR